MPLPPLPHGRQQAVKEHLIRSLPGRWFHGIERGDSPLLPLIDGLATVLAYVWLAWERSVDAAIPRRSSGPWLSLHLKSIGLRRKSDESDESAKLRYEWEFRPTRNTRSGLLAALSFFMQLAPPVVRLETDRVLGRFGQFRFVVRDESRPWSEVDFSFIGDAVRRFVANGIIPSLDVKLQCLLVQRLEPWRFRDQLPMSWNIQGPIWERRSFISAVRLPFARATIAQVSVAEWRTSRDRLLSLHTAGIGDGPGAFFLYLSDTGQCPYLLAEYDLNLVTQNLDQTFARRRFLVDGHHHHDQLVSIGPSIAAGFNAPFLSVPPSPFFIEPLVAQGIQELHEISPGFPGVEQSLDFEVLRYKGLKFSTLKIKKFLVTSPPSEVRYASPELQLMRIGPWTLALTEGDPEWGNFPPQGATLVGSPFRELQPKSIWWTDVTGEMRYWEAEFYPDSQSIYLAMEFILPRGQGRTIRELELRLNGNRVHYRRFSLPIDTRINTGFLFRVRGYGINTVAALQGFGQPARNLYLSKTFK